MTDYTMFCEQWLYSDCSDSSSNELNSLPVTRDIAGGKDFFTKVYYPVIIIIIIIIIIISNFTTTE